MLLSESFDGKPDGTNGRYVAWKTWDLLICQPKLDGYFWPRRPLFQLLRCKYGHTNKEWLKGAWFETGETTRSNLQPF